MSAEFRSSSGDVITFEIEGVDEVQAELDQLADDLKAKASLEMVTRVGEAVQYWMQQNILAQGLLRSGNLFRSIFATPMTNDEGAVVYVGPNTEQAPYALIQNYGGTVPAHWVAPVNARALHWQQGGMDLFSKGHMVGVKNPIIIEARPYIEPAYDDHQEEILDIMRQVLDEAIAEEVATSGASSIWRG